MAPDPARIAPLVRQVLIELGEDPVLGVVRDQLATHEEFLALVGRRG